MSRSLGRLAGLVEMQNIELADRLREVEDTSSEVRSIIGLPSKKSGVASETAGEGRRKRSSLSSRSRLARDYSRRGFSGFSGIRAEIERNGRDVESLFVVVYPSREVSNGVSSHYFRGPFLMDHCVMGKIDAYLLTAFFPKSPARTEIGGRKVSQTMKQHQACQQSHYCSLHLECRFSLRKLLKGCFSLLLSHTIHRVGMRLSHQLFLRTIWLR